jgi:hypothetical protein
MKQSLLKYVQYNVISDCGEIKAFSDSTKDPRFPWTAAIYVVYSNGDHRFLCSGTLIEPSFLLTSANCLSEAENFDSARLQKLYKVVVSPISQDFIANSKDKIAQILNVSAGFKSWIFIYISVKLISFQCHIMSKAKQIWIPSSYNNRTKSSELALLKLERPVTLGGYVRPVCYILPSTAGMPTAGTYGSV